MYSEQAGKNIVANLRRNFSKECEPYTDAHILYAYSQYSISEDYGDGDAKFPEWLGVDGGAESITDADRRNKEATDKMTTLREKEGKGKTKTKDKERKTSNG